MEAHLYLEARLPMVGSATDFTYKWCVNMGLDPDEASRIALATDEILTDVVLYAFPEETGHIEIWYQYSFSDVEIIIQEKGEPFDPDRYKYSQGKALQANDFSGASLEVVRKMTDQFLFLNRGNDGKEFRLMKRLPSADIRDIWNKSNESAEMEEAEDEATEEYLLTPVTSEDAEDIAKLIYRTYSYTYPKEELYYPKRIETAIHQNYKFGTIVRTESGYPAGYFAVIKSTDSMIGEVGEAVVSPNHRKRGLMTQMMHQLISMSRQQGLLGLFGEAVTSHTFSQRVNERFGFRSSAMVLAHSMNRTFKGIKVKPSDTISVVIDFLPLTSKWCRPASLPKTYEKMLTDIYSQFDSCLAQQAAPAGDYKMSGPANLDLNINYANRSALIIVREFGATFELSCSRTLRSIERLRLPATYIDLPVEHPSTNAAIKWLKGQNFILAGLMPLFHNEQDYLRMQLINARVDFDLIKTHSLIAGKLKKIIEREYHAVQKREKSA